MDAAAFIDSHSGDDTGRAITARQGVEPVAAPIQRWAPLAETERLAVTRLRGV